MKWPCIRSWEQVELWWLYYGEDVRPVAVVLAVVVIVLWIT